MQTNTQATLINKVVKNLFILPIEICFLDMLDLAVM